MDRKIVGFKLAGEEFAFAITQIVEIIKMKDITEIPTAPAFIEGVINLRGKIIPIIDLRKRFGINTAGRGAATRIVIVEYAKNQLTGIIVDEVSKVMNVKEDDMLPPPPMISSVGGKYIDSIVKQADRIIVLLDIIKIFSEDEQKKLQDVTETGGGQA